MHPRPLVCATWMQFWGRFRALVVALNVRRRADVFGDCLLTRETPKNAIRFPNLGVARGGSDGKLGPDIEDGCGLAESFRFPPAPPETTTGPRKRARFFCCA